MSKAANKAGPKEGHKPAWQEVDPVLHQPARLSIVSVLAARGGATFGEMREALEMTEGNLSTHAQKLEEAGYLAIEKGFEGRRPVTTFTLTRAGRAALSRYLGQLEAIMGGARR